MIDWTDKAIDAAWRAFWGENHQIEKADMRAALDAAVEAQNITDEDPLCDMCRENYDEGYASGCEDSAILASKLSKLPGLDLATCLALSEQILVYRDATNWLAEKGKPND